ncbi:MAG: hypothetical protein RIR72_221 [Actinomycetota bacterium]|jgi:hypothetical protein
MMWNLVAIGIARVGQRKIRENQKLREVEALLGFNAGGAYAKSLLTT